MTYLERAVADGHAKFSGEGKTETVLWALRAKLCRDIMHLRSRGGTPSRYRLDADDIAAILFPTFKPIVQERISTEARRLRAEAEADWQAVKRWFEEQLLGPAQP